MIYSLLPELFATSVVKYADIRLASSVTHRLTNDYYLLEDKLYRGGKNTWDSVALPSIEAVITSALELFFPHKLSYALIQSELKKAKYKLRVFTAHFKIQIITLQIEQHYFV